MRSAGFLALDTYLSPVDERNASSDAPGAERRCLGNISQSCVQDCATVSSGGNLVLMAKNRPANVTPRATAITANEGISPGERKTGST